jgi:hypothetical protein
MTLYNLKSALDDYRITKFTPDLDVESSYLIGRLGTGPWECECPAGSRNTCRHREMIPNLLPLVDTEWFWDFERRAVVSADGNLRPATQTDPVITPNSILDDIPFVEITTPAKPNGHSHEVSPALDLAISAELSHPPADIMTPPKTHWRRI